MKAIAIAIDTCTPTCLDIPEPCIQSPKDIKLKVLEVGICRTDMELIFHKAAKAPPGKNTLILGHEMLAEVVDVGANVTRFKPGDFAAVTVRRGCGLCAACLSGRHDYCSGTGYTERGIKELDGFQAEYVVDQEPFVIKVPRRLRSCGVLCEPMSIVEKAVENLLSLQKTRLPGWTKNPQNKNVLVIGLGVLGFLSCILLKLHGFQLYGQDILPEDSLKAQLLRDLGGTYIDGRTIEYTHPALSHKFDLIIETAGAPSVHFQVLHALASNGGCAFLGLPPQVPAPHTIFSGPLIQQLVLRNQLFLGSVNAAPIHWKRAIKTLSQAERRWPGIASRLITSRVPYTHFQDVFFRRDPENIKSILTWE